MSQKEKKANYNTDDITLEVTNESGNKVKKKEKINSLIHAMNK